MQYLLRREDKSDGSYEHILEVILGKKDVRGLFKRKQRISLDVRDITSNEDVPLKLTEIIFTGLTKEGRRRPSEKALSDRRTSKRKEAKRKPVGEGLPSVKEEEDQITQVPREPDN